MRSIFERTDYAPSWSSCCARVPDHHNDTMVH
nr:MAG TPA: hypothetical protein [Caudoviricetes sp.]